MKKTAFLFPGQGAQYIGMSKKLCNIFKTAEETFEEANETLGFNLQDLCFNGEIEELTKTENAQPAILTASVAAYRVFKEEIGTHADFSAGHSLGEISALCCAGVINFKDALLLVQKRGRFMSDAVPNGEGAMAAVGGISREQIETECERVSKSGKTVVCANYNSPDQIVISGTSDAVKEVSENLTAMGAFAIPLRVSGPFHSPLMKPAAEKFESELQNVKFNEPQNVVLSNYTAKPYNNNYVENLTKQITNPVRFVEIMNYLKENGVELAVEMGPKQILKGLMNKTVPTLKTLSFDVDTDLEEVKSELSENNEFSEANEVNCEKLMKMCLCNAVCTKNSNWDNDEYKTGVVDSYKKLVTIRENAESMNSSKVNEALTLLKTIFDTKKVPKEEQIERFDEIFEKTGARLNP